MIMKQIYKVPCFLQITCLIFYVQDSIVILLAVFSALK